MAKNDTGERGAKTERPEKHKNVKYQIWGLPRAHGPVSLPTLLGAFRDSMHP